MNPLLSGLLRAILFCAGTTVSFLPRPAEVSLGRLLGRLLYALDWKRKRIGRENMARCLPELPATERERLLAENYRHYGILALELIHYFSPFPGHYPAYVRRVVVLEGYEHWRKANARGKGVIFISGHFANWELMVAVGGLHGIPLTLVTRHLKPEWLHLQIEAGRLSIGCRCVYQPRTLPTILKALRQGESLGIAMDQYMPPPMGSPTPFFGTRVDTLAAVGPLAARTGAAVLSATQRREPDGRVRVILSPALDLGPLLKDPAATNARLVREIENMIRANPSQWLWIHRRFKNLEH
ncbi:MAG: lysophospholipid acyltransferase family protein [Elusimicrobia bacterium]|nr:lysophospholipid acyltransferase family protein [Elusimicrobiota bacterium]